MATGIYVITNTITKMKYVGYSRNVPVRIASHKTQLRTRTHSNSRLQNSFSIHGEGVFIFKQEMWCEVEDLENAEQALANILISNGYILYNVGKHLGKPTLGIPRSEASKLAQSMRMTGSRNPMHGKVRPASVKEKLRAANIGLVQSESTRLKRSKSMLGIMSGNKHPMYGKTHTNESNIKRSNSCMAINRMKSRFVVGTDRDKAFEFQLIDAIAYGFSASQILRVIAGKRKSYKKLLWSYKNA